MPFLDTVHLPQPFSRRPPPLHLQSMDETTLFSCYKNQRTKGHKGREKGRTQGTKRKERVARPPPRSPLYPPKTSARGSSLLMGTQNRKHYLCTRIIIDDGGQPKQLRDRALTYVLGFIYMNFQMSFINLSLFCWA